MLDGPIVLQKENVSPFLTVVPFNLEQVIDILFCLEESVEYIFVENVAKISSLICGVAGGFALALLEDVSWSVILFVVLFTSFEPFVDESFWLLFISCFVSLLAVFSAS